MRSRAVGSLRVSPGVVVTVSGPNVVPDVSRMLSDACDRDSADKRVLTD